MVRLSDQAALLAGHGQQDQQTPDSFNHGLGRSASLSWNLRNILSELTRGVGTLALKRPKPRGALQEGGSRFQFANALQAHSADLLVGVDRYDNFNRAQRSLHPTSQNQAQRRFLAVNGIN